MASYVTMFWSTPWKCNFIKVFYNTHERFAALDIYINNKNKKKEDISAAV